MKKLIVLVSTICIGILFARYAKEQSLNVSVEKSVSQNDTKVVSKIGSTEDFIKLLEKSGYKINSSTQEDKGFLSGTPTAVNINDDTICVYEYKDNKQMEEDLKTISSDGSMAGNALVEWIKTPHLYNSGNIIAIYVGENKEMIKTLEKLLGKQSAGM